MTIGGKIKAARKIKGLTQKQLADELKVSQAMIGQYENGIRKPKFETKERIAKVLDISVVDLMDDDPEYQLAFISGMQDYMDALELANGDVDLAKEIAELKIKMLSDFSCLNINGQKKAADHIEMLTKIPEYRKEVE